jgi:hypothetical protein
VVKKGGRTVNKQTGARVVVAGSTAGLLLASGVLVAPPGAAHQQDGDGDLPCCQSDDYVYGEVTKPENNTTELIHVDAECGWAEAACSTTAKNCRDISESTAQTESQLTCSGSTVEGGHIHCSVNEVGDDEGSFEEMFMAPPVGTSPPWTGDRGGSSGVTPATSIALLDAETGHVCVGDHCHAFEPEVTSVPTPSPVRDDVTVLSTPW